MDNGHTKANGQVNGIFSGADQYQPALENPYFTAGEGNIPAEVLATPEENLNQENWGQPLENPLPAAVKAEETPKNPYELGQITPIKPVDLNQPATIPTPEIPEATPQKYNPANVHITGDRLDKNTISEVANEIEELNQTGDLNNFYDEIRGENGMFDAAIGNSFNRKLGDDQGKAA